MPAVASELGGDSAAVARKVVLLGLIRDWADWPLARRLAVIIPGSPQQMDPRHLLEDGLVVLAVDHGEAANAELLRGLAALARAGGGARVKAQGNMVCLENEALPDQVCAKAGPGYLALGGQKALSKLAAPAAGAALPTASGALLQLRAEMASAGTAQLTVARQAGLTISAALTAENAMMAQQLEMALNDGLRKLDERQAAGRDQVGPALEAAKLTLDRLLDREGNYAAIRQSIKIARNGGALTAELKIPESLLKGFARSGGMTSTVGVVGVVGVLAAIALPNFITSQCRSKQSEAKANLKGAFVAQKSFFQEKDRLGKSFEEIGFQPEPGRYTYCIPGQCLPCSRAGCKPPDADHNPCIALVPQAEPPALRVCAVTEMSAGKQDVWVIDDKGVPENVRNGCQ